MSNSLRILEGRVVTMAGPVIEHGAVYVRGDVIVAVQPIEAVPPDGFEGVARLQTGGVIYPGLMDLHNHLPYNILPLWRLPSQLTNRSQWLRSSLYKQSVREPMALLAGGPNEVIRAIIRYVEVKLLMGGVTCGQGMRSTLGGHAYYRGLVRNFEAPGAEGLGAIHTHVPDLKEAEFGGIRKAIASGRPCFIHLAEGTDDAAREQFSMLARHDLLKPNVVGIHCLGLRETDHQAGAEAGMRLVWSPFSNIVLYGSTLAPRHLELHRDRWGLGSDWTFSGSRNILQELKVAWLCAQQEPDPQRRCSPQSLVHAVTRGAAEAAQWHARLGTLEPGKLADVLVLAPRQDDVFLNLIHATERDVRLVMIAGQARHGDVGLMAQCVADDTELEPIDVGGQKKALYLQQVDSPLNGLALQTAASLLRTTMSDLAALRLAKPAFAPLEIDEAHIELELDMPSDPLAPELEALDALPPLDGIPLDGLTLVDDPAYFDALDAIAHVPAFMKGHTGLRAFYA